MLINYTLQILSNYIATNSAISGQYQNSLEKINTGKDRNLHLSLLDLSDSFDAREMLLYIILVNLNLDKQL